MGKEVVREVGMITDVPLAFWIHWALQMYCKEGRVIETVFSRVRMTHWRNWWSEVVQDPNQATMKFVRRNWWSEVVQDPKQATMKFMMVLSDAHDVYHESDLFHFHI